MQSRAVHSGSIHIFITKVCFGHRECGDGYSTSEGNQPTASLLRIGQCQRISRRRRSRSYYIEIRLLGAERLPEARRLAGILFAVVGDPAERPKGCPKQNVHAGYLGRVRCCRFLVYLTNYLASVGQISKPGTRYQVLQQQYIHHQHTGEREYARRKGQVHACR